MIYTWTREVLHIIYLYCELSTSKCNLRIKISLSLNTRRLASTDTHLNFSRSGTVLPYILENSQLEFHLKFILKAKCYFGKAHNRMFSIKLVSGVQSASASSIIPEQYAARNKRSVKTYWLDFENPSRHPRFAHNLPPPPPLLWHLLQQSRHLKGTGKSDTVFGSCTAFRAC